MPGECLKCVNCIKMDVEDGQLPKEFIEYDFAEDALDFETQLAEARDIKFTQTLTDPLAIGSLVICTGTPSEDLPWYGIFLMSLSTNGQTNHLVISGPSPMDISNTIGKTDTLPAKKGERRMRIKLAIKLLAGIA